MPRDQDCFKTYLEVPQQKLDRGDRIVLPLGQHLFIVQPAKTRQWLIKCDCGHEFCDYRENWKLEALINVRETVEELREIYPDKMHGDPRWNVLREYFCPGCKTLLEVEAVPPGYPPVHDFVPDLEGFYNDWLGRPLPA